MAGGLSLQFHSDRPCAAVRLPDVSRSHPRDRSGAGQRQKFSGRGSRLSVRQEVSRDQRSRHSGGWQSRRPLGARRTIGKHLAKRGERLSAFYASNVEFYLFRDGSFGRFVANLAQVPRTDTAVVIRSVFGGGRVSLAPTASLIQPIGALVDGVARGQFRRVLGIDDPRPLEHQQRWNEPYQWTVHPARWSSRSRRRASARAVSRSG